MAFALLLWLMAPACGHLETCRPAMGEPDYTRCLARQGDPSAQFALGNAYENGVGVEADAALAARWYRRAAAPRGGETSLAIPSPTGEEAHGRLLGADRAGTPGNAEAQYRLGRMYLEGRGVDKSRSRARNWLGRAAEQGHEAAADLLARIRAGAFE